MLASVTRSTVAKSYVRLQGELHAMSLLNVSPLLHISRHFPYDFRARDHRRPFNLFAPHILLSHSAFKPFLGSKDRFADFGGDGFCPRSAPVFDETQTKHHRQHFFPFRIAAGRLISRAAAWAISATQSFPE